uniref:Polyprotein p42 n=1 Tax=Cane toad influenza-like virus TaxID=2777031 RepID=A0A866W084_9ORTO|nr:matrix protein [Cane toad influenza-like virus]
MAQENLLAELEASLKGVNAPTRTAIIKSAKGGFEAAKDTAKALKKGEMATTNGEAMTAHICFRAMYPKIKAWQKVKEMLDRATEDITPKTSKMLKRRMRKAGDFTGLKEVMEMMVMGEDKKAEMVEAIYDNPEDYTEDVRIGTVAAWLECKNKRSERYKGGMSSHGKLAMDMVETEKASKAIDKMAQIVPMKIEATQLREEAEMLQELAREAYGTRLMGSHLQGAISGIGDKVNYMAGMAMGRLVSAPIFFKCFLIFTLIKKCIGQENKTSCDSVLEWSRGETGLAITAISLGAVSTLYILAKMIIIVFNVWKGNKISYWIWKVKSSFYSLGDDDQFSKDIMTLEKRLEAQSDQEDHGDSLFPEPVGFDSSGVIVID